MNCSFQLICSNCRIPLAEATVCESCGKTYFWLKEGGLISFQVDSNRFYENCYENLWKRRRDLTLPLRDVLLWLRERLSQSIARKL